MFFEVKTQGLSLRVLVWRLGVSIYIYYSINMCVCMYVCMSACVYRNMYNILTYRTSD